MCNTVACNCRPVQETGSNCRPVQKDWLGTADDSDAGCDTLGCVGTTQTKPVDSVTQSDQGSRQCDTT